MSFRFALVLVCIALFPSFEAMASGCEKPERLVFSQILGNSAHSVGAKILEQAYSDLGIDLEFKQLPARRALNAAAHGETDGEVFRIKDIEIHYPGLVRIQVPLLTLNGFAYTKNGEKINRMDNLQEYRVGILRGIIWSEQGVKSSNVVRLENNGMLLEKLLKGGIDVAVTIDFSFDKEIQKREAQSLITRGDPLVSFDVFHYLNKKYACLVPEIDHHIQALRDDGTVEKLAKAY